MSVIYTGPSKKWIQLPVPRGPTDNSYTVSRNLLTSFSGIFSRSNSFFLNAGQFQTITSPRQGSTEPTNYLDWERGKIGGTRKLVSQEAISLPGLPLCLCRRLPPLSQRTASPQSILSEPRPGAIHGCVTPAWAVVFLLLFLLIWQHKKDFVKNFTNKTKHQTS